MQPGEQGSRVNHMVAVAMSGGVDSSVTAAILKEQGYRVVGVGLQLIDETLSEGSVESCCGMLEMEDARRVAETLLIPFYVLNFRELFREQVIDYFTSSYLRGETPNPCVPCNGVVKFDHLLRTSIGLGADFLATGHYARVELDRVARRYVLRKGTDESKDQSYFLYSLRQEQLARALFPMGEMTKTETRRVARDLGLKVHDKPDSQDVCFVGADGYAPFVSARAAGGAGPGPILDESASVIGIHRGIYNYTVGQRRGLGISFPEPMYVTDIDPGTNSITCAPGSRPRRQERVLLESMNYVSIGALESPLPVEAKTRYRKPEVPATLVPSGEKSAIVEFDAPQETTAPGQSVVLYRGDRVIGGGIVKREG